MITIPFGPESVIERNIAQINCLPEQRFRGMPDYPPTGATVFLLRL